MEKKKYDLVIAGGGVAGCAAALAAARRGLKCAVIEKTVSAGGLATNGLVLVYLPLCDGAGHQVSFGITEELLHACNTYGPHEVPEWQDGSGRFQVYFSPASLILALDELLLKAGVDLWFDTVLIGASSDKNKRVRSIEVWNKSGRIEIFADCFIDATGDADLAYLAGNKCLSATNSLVTWVIEHREQSDQLTVCNYGRDTSVRIVANPITDVFTEPGISGKMVSDFVIAARAKYLKILQEEYESGISSPKKRYPIAFPSMPTLRHTRCISAVEPMQENMAWQSVEKSIGLAADWRKRNSVWEMPFGMLIPDNVEGVLAAGRAAGAIGDAWEISRVIPAAALTGEVSGVAAAIAAKHGIMPSKVDYEELAFELQKGRKFPLKISELGLVKPEDGTL